MLRKQYRLTSNVHIRELRQRGQSWHNRWFVLVKRANNRQQSRFAFSVSRKLGKAVVRNRIKRVMRDCTRRRLASILAGWDVLLIARQPALGAPFEQIDEAIADLLIRSRLQVENSGPTQIRQLAASPARESNLHGTRAL